MEINAQINWQRTGKKYNAQGENFMQKDWDVLTILDACRYDTFAKCSNLPGELQMITSRGGGTQEFLRGNFKDEQFHDTVYITANPQIERHEDWLNVSFYEIRNIWETGWNDELRTVTPETMAQAALDAASDFPNKRLLVHFNQPHSPYIGEVGRKSDSFSGRIKEEDDSIENGFLSDLLRDLKHPGEDEEHREIYKENLNLALPYVQSIMDEISGLHVVTADHGEMLGERGYPIPITYHGHRMGCHVDELVKVPWLEYQNGDRREIFEDDPVTSSNVDNNVVKDRLQDLGYAE